MTQNEIFAQRLKNARVMKGYAMDELVAAMGNSLSKMAISKYEKCQLSPSSSVLISLSKALGQPVDYFFRPFTMQIESVKFRKHKSKLAVKQEESIRQNISDMFERYITIEEICNASVKFVSPFKKPLSSAAQVKEAALKLRDFWNIGSDGIINVIDLLEEHGIKVIEIDAPESFDGLSSMVNDLYPVIVLNKAFSSERKRFTALHELGHLILNFDDSVSEKDEETLCNLFANEMLILESMFRRIVGDSRREISYPELKAVQIHFGISCDALMYKAKTCGIISEPRYKSYCIQKNRDSAFKERIEQSYYPHEESNRFNRLVYNALSNELITISKAASLLHKSVEQVRGELMPV